VEEPEAHLDLVRARLREQARLASEHSPERFAQEVRARVAAAADAETAAALLQAAPPEQQWLGLDRYLRSR
jgi:hypothetical protein